MNKKLLSIVLVTVLIMALVLTACGKTEQSNADDPNKQATENSENQDTAKKVIKVGGKQDSKPYIYEENGVVKGFEADIWEEMCKRGNFEIEYEFNSIGGLFGLLDNGKIDLITNFIGVNKQRQEKYDFSDPYAFVTMHVMIKNDKEEIKSIEELYGKTVGVGEGSNAMGILKSVDPEGKIIIKPYEEVRNIPLDVDMGRIDAYFGHRVTMNDDIKKLNVDCKINPMVISAVKVAYPFRKDDPKSAELKEEINKLLKEMKEDGTISKISEKWFGLDVTTLDGFNIKEEDIIAK